MSKENSPPLSIEDIVRLYPELYSKKLFDVFEETGITKR